MRWKVLKCCLSVVMVVSLFSVPVSAAGAPSAETTEYIPENVAEIIASYFVDDICAMPDSKWTSDTVVSNSVTMYDTDGAVSAYSFELTTNGRDTGYVVVSAYSDVESVILEFSDVEKPLYEVFNLAPMDSVVYTGTLNYFKKENGDDLLAIDGAIVNKYEVPEPLTGNRDVEKLPSPMSSVIEDPFAWAGRYYGGQFSAIEWKNVFEDYCDFGCMDEFKRVNSTQYYRQ